MCCSSHVEYLFFWNRTGKSFPVDIYGTGPHWEDIKQTARKMELPVSIFRFISLDVITDRFCRRLSSGQKIMPN